MKSNDLVEARYRLSLQESHVVLWLLIQIKPEDEDFKTHELNVDEFAKMVGLRVDSQYEELQKTMLSLLQRVMKIYSPEHKKLVQIAWLSSAVYEDGKGYVSLRFDPELKPYLLQLKSQFTKISIADTLQFKSIYAVRIYELLTQYGSIGKREISVDELRDYCGIEEKEYELYASLKRDVINRAKTEINAKTDYEIDYKELKRSRKVVGINFSINKNIKCLPKNIKSEEEVLPVSSIFNEITGVNKKISASKEKELLQIIKSHNLPGYLLENWKTGLFKAMENAFYSGKKLMKKGDEKGQLFQLTIQYAAENLPELLALEKKANTEQTNDGSASFVPIKYESCQVPEIIDFCKSNVGFLPRDRIDYLLNAQSFINDDKKLIIGFSNGFYRDRSDTDEVKNKLIEFFKVQDVEIVAT